MNSLLKKNETFETLKIWKFDEEYLNASRLALYGDSAKMALDSLFSISSLSSKILHQIRNSSLFPYKLSKLLILYNSDFQTLLVGTLHWQVLKLSL